MKNKIIKILTKRNVLHLFYWLNLILAGVIGTLVVVWALKNSVILGILALFFIPLAFSAYAVILRIILEAAFAINEISDQFKKFSSYTEGGFYKSKKKIEEYEVED